VFSRFFFALGGSAAILFCLDYLNESSTFFTLSSLPDERMLVSTFLILTFFLLAAVSILSEFTEYNLYLLVLGLFS
jgi:hypothetical protein